MKLRFKFVLFLLFIAFAGLCQPAKSLFERAMAKSGEWERLQSIAYSTQGLNYNKWQRYDFTEQGATNDETIRKFDFAHQTYYYKTVSRYAGGYVFEFVNVGKDSSRYVYDALTSRNGVALQKGGRKDFEAGWQTLNQTFPFYILKSALRSGDELVEESDSTVLRKLKTGHERFVFRKELLAQVTRTQNGKTTIQSFHDYLENNGLIYPKVVKVFAGGELTRVDEVKSFEPNQALDHQLLIIPSKYKLLDSSPPGIAVKEIAKDVYIIENVPGERNVLFVKMDSGVFITEAPLSTEISKAIIELVHKTIPNTKILYVHFSHFHSDHTSGIGAFVSEGANIVATSPTIDAVKTLLDATQGPQAKFQAINDHFTLSDATHEIKLYELQNSHAKGMSFVYLPKEKIIYQGDLFSLPSDGTITPAIAVNREFHESIKKLNLKVDRIIGHHGASNIKISDLEKSLAARQSAPH